MTKILGRVSEAQLESLPTIDEAPHVRQSAQPKVPPIPRLISMADVAHLLGVSERFVRSMATKGQLRVVKLGRRRLVPREEIDRLAEGVTQ